MKEDEIQISLDSDSKWRKAAWTKILIVVALIGLAFAGWGVSKFANKGSIEGKQVTLKVDRESKASGITGNYVQGVASKVTPYGIWIENPKGGYSTEWEEIQGPLFYPWDKVLWLRPGLGGTFR